MSVRRWVNDVTASAALVATTLNTGSVTPKIAGAATAIALSTENAKGQTGSFPSKAHPQLTLEQTQALYLLIKAEIAAVNGVQHMDAPLREARLVTGGPANVAKLLNTKINIGDQTVNGRPNPTFKGTGVHHPDKLDGSGPEQVTSLDMAAMDVHRLGGLDTVTKLVQAGAVGTHATGRILGLAQKRARDNAKLAAERSFQVSEMQNKLNKIDAAVNTVAARSGLEFRQGVEDAQKPKFVITKDTKFADPTGFEQNRKAREQQIDPKQAATKAAAKKEAARERRRKALEQMRQGGFANAR